MATVLELRQRGELLKFDPLLDEDQAEVRFVDALPRFAKWVQETLPKLGSCWKIETSPQEQLDAFLCDYAAGDVLTFEREFHPIQHVKDGVWMLKTADLRLFGWFVKKDHFIAVAGNLAQTVKEHDLYHGYANEVVTYRSNLDLEQQKFIAGDDPNDVVSNFSYPHPTGRN